MEEERNGRAAAGAAIFPGSEQLTVPILFCGWFWAVGWLAGRSGEEPLGRGRRAWKTRLHAPRQATAPRAGSGSVVNPGEERVASCQLHCPKIQMRGFGVVGSLHFITQGKKILAAA